MRCVLRIVPAIVAACLGIGGCASLLDDRETREQELRQRARALGLRESKVAARERAILVAAVAPIPSSSRPMAAVPPGPPSSTAAAPNGAPALACPNPGASQLTKCPSTEAALANAAQTPALDPEVRASGSSERIPATISPRNSGQDRARFIQQCQDQDATTIEQCEALWRLRTER